MKKGFYNLLFGIGGQLVILALGIVIPRFILNSYGDEVNGLINAISQIFVYLALIEAGVGQASVQALYKPIVEKNKDLINETISTTQYYFRRLTYLYMSVVLLFALVYPMFIDKDSLSSISIMGSNYWGIVAFIVVQGFSSAIVFYFCSAVKQLLIADGYNYYIANITTLSRVLSSIVKIILVNMHTNLVVLQIAYFVITILEVISYILIIKWKYPWLLKHEKCNSDLLHERKSFLVHEVSNAIFSSTDMMVLSIFCDLKTVSIYAVYNLVFTSINSLVSQVHSGCFYILGQAYNKKTDDYIKVHDFYDTYYIAFVFSLITVAYILILPFVSLYTKGVTSLNYIDSKLPVLFSLIHLLSCCRITSSTLIKIAGHAKQTVMRTIAEAIINLSVSLVLVNFVGIYGVLLGTIAALLYRTNDMLIYANTKILNRKPVKTYSIVVLNFALFAVFCLLAMKIDINVASYMEFVVYGILISFLCFAVFFIANSILNREGAKMLLTIFRRNRKYN